MPRASRQQHAPCSLAARLLLLALLGAAGAAAFERALLAPAARGPHNKTGMPDPRMWHPQFAKERLGAYRAAAARNALPGAQATLPDIAFSDCITLVNHRYRFVYIRIPKTASSALMAALGMHCPKPAPGVGASPCDVMPAASLPLTAAPGVFDGYFVFSLVRNPYSRAFSAWRFLAFSRKTKHDHAAPGGNATLAELCTDLPWRRFCADPLSAAALCEASPACCKLPAPQFYAQHADAQARCLQTPQGGWAVDYLASQETLQSDVAAIAAAINARRAPGLPALRPQPLELHNGGATADSAPCNATQRVGRGRAPAECVLDTAYADDTGCVRQVQRVYAHDFDALGYPR